MYCWARSMRCGSFGRPHGYVVPPVGLSCSLLEGSRTDILCMQTFAPAFAMSKQGVLGPRDSVPSLGQEAEVGREDSCFEDG